MNPFPWLFGVFEKIGANPAIIFIPLGLVLFYIVFKFIDVDSSRTLGYVIAGAPLYLPVVTFLLAFEFWLAYVQKDFDMKQGRVTLEIRLPQEIFKSPEAMELVLIQLHQTAAPDNHIQTYWDGKHPPTYALEVVSRGGDVRFYMNVPRKKFKNIAEAQLYAQYPGIEIQELDIDYTAEIPWDTTRFSYFSLHFGLKKEDALPIKTYIEYGLHTMPKEEEKVDPITSFLEAFASIGPNEYLWAQILITANRESTFKTGSLIASPDWKAAAKKHIRKIIEEANARVGVKEDKETRTTLSMMNLTDSEKETIRAIERSLGKNAFDTVIRGMYIATNEAYLPGERIGALITSWRGYDDLNRNAIGVRWRTDFDWPMFQDRKGRRTAAYKKQELDEYKRRAYTHHNRNDKSKVMTTEELATIFHLPGKVAVTPSLARLPSKRAEAPANLPTG